VASCLGCHEAPTGKTDITLYSTEGASLGDLGGGDGPVRGACTLDRLQAFTQQDVRALPVGTHH
jgi:hypothetical protein